PAPAGTPPAARRPRELNCAWPVSRPPGVSFPSGYPPAPRTQAVRPGKPDRKAQARKNPCPPDTRARSELCLCRRWAAMKQLVDSGRPQAPFLDEATDRSLLRGFKAGSDEAATQLYLRYARRLYQLARAQCPPDLAQRVDADDIVQSVFSSF